MVEKRVSKQNKAFRLGWTACKEWGLGEAHPDCPYGYYDSVEHFKAIDWRTGFSQALSTYSDYVDDLPVKSKPPKSGEQLSLF